PGKKYAMAFTFMVHAGLIAALFFGVQWKRSKPEVMEVELWSSRPVPAVQVAEPPPPTARTGGKTGTQTRAKTNPEGRTGTTQKTGYRDQGREKAQAGTEETGTQARATET
ncbi:MAG: hypothetical protein ABTQ26_16705, partial [Azonexus sp.]